MSTGSVYDPPMTGAGQDIAVFDAGDGLLLFGSESALAMFDAEAAVPARPISRKDLARLGGQAGGGASKLMEQGGRWVKLTADSAKDARAVGGVDKLTSGVLRGDKGQILKHLNFENLGRGAVLTPAAPAVLGAMATQYALEAALDDITAYLETIDRKLDQLLRQRKTETLGEIGGVTLAIDEAAAIYSHTGVVSGVTWSKVEGLAFTLQRMQWEAVEQLHEVAKNVQSAAGDADKSAKALAQAQEDAEFWLGVLARAIALQDRYYVLELARVAAEDVMQLETHRQGIAVARADRVRRITHGLQAVSGAVISAAALSNAAKVANPIAAPKVARHANGLSVGMSSFAEHANLELGVLGVVDETRWARAARELAGEASSAVVAGGSGAAARARAAGQALAQRRDEKVLRRARKIEERRGSVE